ncbi:MarR family winged helix-turn-helix transcriptional regulator [Streptomyces sp. T028]|uniref:MarR family winged helix-turn-helix transcriptional regulator n=1 Tax=Streptomyces sp. T028 TaxID=3394379 RepID=UPI003A86D430
MSERTELYDGLETFLQYLFTLAESEELSVPSDMEVSFTQVRALVLLTAADEPRPIHQVAQQLGLSLTSASRNIDRLVRLGSVERRECSADRRVKLVSVTPHGRRVVDQHLEPRRRAVRTFVERLPDGNVRAFLTALRPLLADGSFAVGPTATQLPLPPTDQTDQKETHVHHSR